MKRERRTWRKRTMTSLLTLTLLFSALFAGSAMAEESVLEPHERLLNDVLGYAYLMEKMDEELIWVLDAFESFDKERSWEALQKARATLVIARREVEAIAFTGLESTLEDLMGFMEEGKDFSYVETIQTDVENTRESLLNLFENFHSSIQTGVFLEKDWDQAMDRVDMKRREIELYLQYYANTVDWTMATLGQMEVSEKFQALMEEYCPLIHAKMAKEVLTPEQIEETNQQLFEQLDECVLEQAKLVGAGENSLNWWQDIVEEGDLQPLIDNALEISGLPLVLFYPDWYDDMEAFYYWKEGEEIKETPRGGTKLETPPDGCYIEMKGVSLEQVQDYMKELESAGIPCTGSRDHTYLYEIADSSFVFSWEEDTVTFLLTEKPVCFAPLWYVLSLLEGESS